jgi:hypothetical protein
MSSKKSKRTKTAARKGGKKARKGRKPPLRVMTGGKKRGRKLSDAESAAIDETNKALAGSIRDRAAGRDVSAARRGLLDPRLPAVGEKLVRTYKGEEHEVEVRATGFGYKGEEYRSLSKLASVITGAKAINGFAFFKLLVPRGKAV